MDARSLLRAKRQEAKIVHPYASYTTGTLRCTICSLPVKDGAAWDGHLGSKSHRKNLARVKEEQRAAEEAEAALVAQQQQEQRASSSGATKRAAPEDTDAGSAAKKIRTGSGFPSDFFSDASRAIPAEEDMDSDEDDEDDGPSAAAIPPPAEPKGALDLEWEAFQREVINTDVAAEEKEEAYARATVAAEEQLFDELEGFPAELAARRAAAQAGTEAVPDESLVEEETEQQKQARKEQDDRELIMDRILEEERAQEEADNKVAMMKVRGQSLSVIVQT